MVFTHRWIGAIDASHLVTSWRGITAMSLAAIGELIRRKGATASIGLALRTHDGVWRVEYLSKMTRLQRESHNGLPRVLSSI